MVYALIVKYFFEDSVFIPVSNKHVLVEWTNHFFDRLLFVW